MKNKSDSFANYVRGILKDSMLTGVPQIAGATNTPKKILRAIVFVLCIGGFVFQSHTFMKMYWEYKVLVDVKIESPKDVPIPSFTVCNINGIQRTRFIAKRPDSVLNVTGKHLKELCTCTPRYCDGKGNLLPGMKIPYFFYLSEYNNSPQKDVEEFLQPLNDLVEGCIEFGMTPEEFNERDCNFSDTVSIRAKSPLSQPNVCYTLNSLIYRPKEEPREVLSTASVKVLVNPNAMEYDAEIAVPNIQVSVHSPYNVLNPYKGGFNLAIGKFYTLRLRKLVKIALPPPYSTRCIDYRGLWKSRGGYGPTNEMECIQECFVNISLAAYECVPDFIDWPHNHALCEDLRNLEDLYNMADSCSKQNCSMACLEESYIIDVDSMDGELSSVCKDMESDAQEVFFEILLNRMETTYYIYKPQFESIETFSYVGGYVGMWLGISLLAIFDFVESLVAVINYPCGDSDAKQRKRKSNKVIQVKEIRH